MQNCVVELFYFSYEIRLTLLDVLIDFDSVVVFGSQELLLGDERLVDLLLLFEIRFHFVDANGTVQVVSNKLGAERRGNVPFLSNVGE